MQVMAAYTCKGMAGRCLLGVLLLFLALAAPATAAVDPLAQPTVSGLKTTPRFPVVGGIFTASFDVYSFGYSSPAVELQLWADQPVLQNCSGPSGDIKARVPSVKAFTSKSVAINKVKAPQAAGPHALRVLIDSKCELYYNEDGTGRRYQVTVPYTVTPAPIPDLSFDKIVWAKNGRYEGVYWSATTAAQTFGVKMSVSNQGTLPGKLGAIKFWSVPFGSPFVPSCNATADVSTALKSDTIAPLGKSKTFTVKGIPAPATPGKKTLVGFVDGDCATAEADEDVDNKITFTYKVLPQPLPGFLVTSSKAKRTAAGTAEFRITIKNVGLAAGALGVVSVFRSGFEFREVLNCSTYNTTGWGSSAAVTTPIEVGKSAVVVVPNVPLPYPVTVTKTALVLVDGACQVPEIFDVFEDPNTVHSFTSKYRA